MTSSHHLDASSLSFWLTLWLFALSAVCAIDDSLCSRLVAGNTKRLRAVTLLNGYLRLTEGEKQYRLPLSAIDKQSIHLENAEHIKNIGKNKKQRLVLADVTGKEKLKWVRSNGSVVAFFTGGSSSTWLGPYYAVITDAARLEFHDKPIDGGEPLLEALPAFGFIHESIVHLWNTRQHEVFLFKFPPLQRDKSEIALSMSVVPFEQYFKCSRESGHSDEHSLNSPASGGLKKKRRKDKKGKAFKRGEPGDGLYLVLVISAGVLITAFVMLTIGSYAAQKRREIRKRQMKAEFFGILPSKTGSTCKRTPAKKRSKYTKDNKLERSVSAISSSDPPRSPIRKWISSEAAIKPEEQ